MVLVVPFFVGEIDEGELRRRLKLVLEDNDVVAGVFVLELVADWSVLEEVTCILEDGEAPQNHRSISLGHELSISVLVKARPFVGHPGEITFLLVFKVLVSVISDAFSLIPGKEKIMNIGIVLFSISIDSLLEERIKEIAGPIQLFFPSQIRVKLFSGFDNLLSKSLLSNFANLFVIPWHEWLVEGGK